MTPNPYASANPNPFLSRTDVGALIPNTIASGLTGLFGGGLALLPWQRGLLQQQFTPPQNLAHVVGTLASELRRDMANIAQMLPRRPKPGPYWQFKNGKVARIDLEILRGMDDEEWEYAWDRSLGSYVAYSRR